MVLNEYEMALEFFDRNGNVGSKEQMRNVKPTIKALEAAINHAIFIKKCLTKDTYSHAFRILKFWEDKSMNLTDIISQARESYNKKHPHHNYLIELCKIEQKLSELEHIKQTALLQGIDVEQDKFFVRDRERELERKAILTKEEIGQKVLEYQQEVFKKTYAMPDYSQKSERMIYVLVDNYTNMIFGIFSSQQIAFNRTKEMFGVRVYELPISDNRKCIAFNEFIVDFSSGDAFIKRTFETFCPETIVSGCSMLENAVMHDKIHTNDYFSAKVTLKYDESISTFVQNVQAQWLLNRLKWKRVTEFTLQLVDSKN